METGTHTWGRGWRQAHIHGVEDGDKHTYMGLRMERDRHTYMGQWVEGHTHIHGIEDGERDTHIHEAKDGKGETHIHGAEDGERHTHTTGKDGKGQTHIHGVEDVEATPDCRAGGCCPSDTGRPQREPAGMHTRTFHPPLEASRRTSSQGSCNTTTQGH